jgi:Rha family phage regulatory protein
MEKTMDIFQDEFGIIEYKGVPVVGSRKVAEIFEKDHKHVLDSIRKITEPKSGLSEKFNFINFKEITYKDSTGRKLPEYLLTRDGFTLLAMSFTGKKAMQFKEAYINRFNQMESFIKSLSIAKLEYPELTDAIMALHDKPMQYHFSNEADMINRIVLGIDAKKYRELHGVPDGKSIRPYLKLEEINLILKLQRMDIGLCITTPDYEKRKQILTDYYNRLQLVKLSA